jgi:hypothetical protein
MLFNGWHKDRPGLPELVSVVAINGQFIGYGDPSQRSLAIEPIGKPTILSQLETTVLYRPILQGLAAARPKDANAVAFGNPLVSNGTKPFFETALQFHRIETQEWERLRHLQPLDAYLLHFLNRYES